MSIKLKGSSDGSVSFDAPADTSPSGSDITLTLPTSAGSANQFLKNSGIAGELEYSSMVETSTGIGIGTSAPSNALHVIDSGGTTGSVDIGPTANKARIYAASDGIRFGSVSNDDVIFRTNNAERARITSTGNVAIGTTGPFGGNVSNRRHFTLNGTSSAMLQWGINGTERGYLYADATNLSIINTQNGYLRLNTNNTERVRINDVGRVLFGRAISHDPWGATGNVDAGQYFGSGNNFAAAFNSRNIPCILNRTNSTGTIQEFKYNGQVTGWINTTSTAISINYSSDYRLKENVIPLANAITRVKQLQPKRFNYIIEPDVTVDGFLAHEAQTVVPEAVVGTHNQVDDNSDPVYQGIDPSKMIPLLTAALQEAIAKIETLETKVAALEAA